jgi:hypothetical protein
MKVVALSLESFVEVFGKPSGAGYGPVNGVSKDGVHYVWDLGLGGGEQVEYEDVRGYQKQWEKRTFIHWVDAIMTLLPLDAMLSIVQSKPVETPSEDWRWDWFRDHVEYVVGRGLTRHELYEILMEENK